MYFGGDNLRVIERQDRIAKKRAIEGKKAIEDADASPKETDTPSNQKDHNVTIRVMKMAIEQDHSKMESGLIESEWNFPRPDFDISSYFSGCFNLMCCSRLP